MNPSAALPSHPEKCPRESCVFINCPYDDQYKARFEALLLVVLSYGLLPRWANEKGGSGDSRMERITSCMRGSVYSIHDLSLYKGQGDLNLARMNMALELGMALEQSYPRHDLRRDHRWVALAPAGHPYRGAISDLHGYDLLECEPTPGGVLRMTCSFFQSLTGQLSPSTVQVARRLAPWSDALALQKQHNVGVEPNWLQVMKVWQSFNPQAGDAAHE